MNLNYVVDSANDEMADLRKAKEQEKIIQKHEEEYQLNGVVAGVGFEDGIGVRKEYRRT